MDKAYGIIKKKLSKTPKTKSRIVENKYGQLILDESEIIT